MVTWIWVNIGSGSGLVPSGNKPLPEPMLTYDQWSPVHVVSSDSNITEEDMNRFSWNFQDSSDMAQGTIGNILG